MAEWFKAVVLKTTEALHVSGGSNPSPSAKPNRGGARVDDWGRLLSG
jgi:hypothetical protein